MEHQNFFQTTTHEVSIMVVEPVITTDANLIEISNMAPGDTFRLSVKLYGVVYNLAGKVTKTKGNQGVKFTPIGRFARRPDRKRQVTEQLVIFCKSCEVNFIGFSKPVTNYEVR